ncbi:diacylglycerol kinase 1 isoform X3 [Chironomus tepperi]|uniref:diacylglycerol kinase 1 isoform X3 n=1 Tax=Chironomus tepperi TaxID=113505 RepID=UPI00391EF92C
MASSSQSQWDKLSPNEFQQLQDFASYSSKKLEDVLDEFCGPTSTYKFNQDDDIDFEGFQKFIDLFLDCETPFELSQHLFLSFLRPYQSQLSGSIPNMNNIVNFQCLTPETKTHSFVDTLHGLTDKLHQLRHDDKSKSGTIHPLVTVTPSPLAPNHRRSADSSPTHSHTHSHSQMSRNSSRKSNNSLNCKIDDLKLLPRKQSFLDPLTMKVPLKDVVCYLSLLEAGRPEDKLEFMFRLYDTDGNGVLDKIETDAIVNQMMSVAEYLGWDVSELRPILQDMMTEIDYDGDGSVSLDEWKRGGLTTIPLLVLLGVDSSLKEDGYHVWRLKHFSKPAYCNLCLNMLVGLGKKGLCCTLCKYTVHERCVQRAPASCITTYVKSKRPGALQHHWVEGNCYRNCSKCHKRIKAYSGLTCRWCKMTLHNRCANNVKIECNMGKFSNFTVPPTAICPAVLDRQRSASVTNIRSKVIDSILKLRIYFYHLDIHLHVCKQPAPPIHFQVTLDSPAATPLLVFINPKSGGRQGERILRKFQYLLNPRQVYDLSKTGPLEGLTMFKDVPNFKVICCGGDGTVGWILEAMDSVEMKHQPATAVIPLGTGNDLARCLRWGGGYEGESIPKLFDKISRSEVVMMDRWNVSIEPAIEKEEPTIPAHKVLKVTLSENVQRVVELSQRIVVEKSVINSHEQVQKTSEISIENSKRVILSDNNSSSTSTTVEKSRETTLESNGMLQNCEKFSDKECTVENNSNTQNDENCKNNSSNGTNRPKSSSSCNDLLMFGKSQQSQPGIPPQLKDPQPTAADFSIPYNIINNYFSVGVDAAICVKFHLEREKNPHKFNSRMKNKLWYFEYATSETFSATCKNLHEYVELTCDGVRLDLNGISLQGIALLNIPYTHGGSNLWGENLSQKRIRRSTSSNGPFKKMKKLRSADKEMSTQSFNSVDLSIAIQDIGDRKIEVIGLESCLHMGQVRTGLRASGRRLAQCSEIILKTKKTFPMQIDGEPWMQAPATIKITHKNQVPMLMSPKNDKGRGFFNFNFFRR